MEITSWTQYWSKEVLRPANCSLLSKILPQDLKKYSSNENLKKSSLHLLSERECREAIGSWCKNTDLRRYQKCACPFNAVSLETEENPKSGGWSKQQSMKSKLLIFNNSRIKNWGNLPLNFPYLGVLWRGQDIFLEVIGLVLSYWF